MNAENQKKILDTASQVFGDLAKALGKESFSYEDGIRCICDNGNKTLFDLLLWVITKTVSVVGPEQTLTPDTLPKLLAAMDTPEKAEIVLAEMPDPDPKKLEKILRGGRLFPSEVRKLLLPFAEDLPPPPGGAPRKIPEQEEPAVCAEIAQLFNDGWSFSDAKKEVARRRGTSLPTIQRICRRGNLTLDVLIETLRHKIIKDAGSPPVRAGDKP